MDGTSRASSQYDDDTRHHRPSFQSSRSHPAGAPQLSAVEKNEEAESNVTEEQVEVREENAPTPAEKVEPRNLTTPPRAFPLARRASQRPASPLRESRSELEICTQALSSAGSIREASGSFEILGLSREEVSAILAAAKDPKDPKSRVQSFASCATHTRQNIDTPESSEACDRMSSLYQSPSTVYRS